MYISKKKIYSNDLFKKHWFPFGILCCIFAAAIYPNLGAKNGPLKPEITVKYGAVSLIFFISGLSLKTESFLYTLRQYKLHLFIQGFTFILVPVCLQIFVKFLGVFGLDVWIMKGRELENDGLITVACMPPPVSSAVILTRAVHGNEAAAIFNSVLGSFLGIFITPISLLLNLGFTTLVPLLGTIVQLLLTVLAPLLLGQVIRQFTFFRGHRMPLNLIGQCSLLFVIYTTFCDTFATHEASLHASDILITVFLVVVIQIVLLTASFTGAVYFQKYFTPQDIAAIIFCSTHKSLTLGVPILRIMFHGFSHLGQISLPLLVYHPTQIILGGLLVVHLKDWIRNTHTIHKPPV